MTHVWGPDGTGIANETNSTAGPARETSRLSPDGGVQWMHSVGYGRLDDEDDAPEPETCSACGGEGSVTEWWYEIPCDICRGYGTVVEKVPG